LGSWETASFGINSKFRGHYQLIDNANHRTKMRTCFCLCLNVTQKQVLSEQTCSEISHTLVKWRNITNESIITRRRIFHFL